MRLQNFTKLDTELLREIIRFTCPSGVHRFDIAFKNSGNGYKGGAYIAGCDYHARSMRAKGMKNNNRGFVVIGCCSRRSGKKWTRSYQFCNQGAYLGGTVFGEIEAIVLLVAHELRHLWQRRVKKGHRVWGARGQFSERDADAYAIQKVRQWRRR